MDQTRKGCLVVGYYTAEGTFRSFSTPPVIVRDQPSTLTWPNIVAAFWTWLFPPAPRHVAPETQWETEPQVPLTAREAAYQRYLSEIAEIEIEDHQAWLNSQLETPYGDDVEDSTPPLDPNGDKDD